MIDQSKLSGILGSEIVGPAAEFGRPIEITCDESVTSDPEAMEVIREIADLIGATVETPDKMPPEKVLGKASLLLDRLQKVLRYQSERFDSEAVESFSAESQKALESISMMLSEASESCDDAHKLIERARLLLP